MPLSRREATGRFVHMQVWRVRKALWSRLCTTYRSSSSRLGLGSLSHHPYHSIDTQASQTAAREFIREWIVLIRMLGPAHILLPSLAFLAPSGATSVSGLRFFSCSLPIPASLSMSASSP